MTSMVKALIYKDATTRILRVVCLLAMCWVSLVYTVALMPISLDDSGTNPLTVESSTTLASQALVIIAAALAIIEINSGETAIAALLVGSRRRMAFSLMTAKVVSIVVVGLMLTMVNAIGNFIAYGHGVSGRLMIRYMMLVVMNGVAVLSLFCLPGMCCSDYPSTSWCPYCLSRSSSIWCRLSVTCSIRRRFARWLMVRCLCRIH